MYIKKTIALEWVSATVFGLDFYLNNLVDDTLTCRLSPYVNITEMTNKNPLNPWTNNFQFSYPKTLIDRSNWDELWLLNHIIANEADFTWWIIK